MRKILFIAPYTELMKRGQEVIGEMGLEAKVDCLEGDLNRGVIFGRQAEINGVEVIVTRGGTAELLSKADIKVPVVEIPITFQDLSESLLQAIRETGLKKPKVAVMAFRNMIRSIEVFAKVMEIELAIYLLNSEEEMSKRIEDVIRDGADVLIGGSHTTQMASARGVKTVRLTSGVDSFRTAFAQAEKVLYARQLEKERMKKFRALVNYSVQGIISVDRDGRVEVFNHAAERLLNRRTEKVQGKHIETICPALPLVECLREGKALQGHLMKIDQRQYLVNVIPIDMDEFVAGAMVTIEDVGQIMEWEATIRKTMYQKGLSAQYQLQDILGSSLIMEEVRRVAREYAAIDATVLISGASGTGKELFAQSIHNSSHRRARPFVAVNCGAIPPNLLESELFGYVEGAFTGANKKGKAGFFELAHGGTIFLDEIGEMDKVAQTSLLRVIQERRVMRLGDDRYLPVDVRIIAATNKNLLQLVREGRFREDLFYRLNVLPLELPALRERLGDAVVLAEHFLQHYNRRFERQVMLTEEAKALLNAYEWPGNIRQLRNLIERIVVVSKSGHVKKAQIEAMLGLGTRELPLFGESNSNMSATEKDERAQIVAALENANYQLQQAAKSLKMHRSTLYRKMKKKGIVVKKDATNVAKETYDAKSCN